MQIDKLHSESDFALFKDQDNNPNQINQINIDPEQNDRNQIQEYVFTVSKDHSVHAKNGDNIEVTVY